jgi:hypothetical protein
MTFAQHARIRQGTVSRTMKGPQSEPIGSVMVDTPEAPGLRQTMPGATFCKELT